MIDNITTFTTRVKEEICFRDFNDQELMSLLSGFCKVNGVLSLTNGGFSLSLKTEKTKIAKLLFSAFERLFNVVPSFTYSKKMNFDKCSVFEIKVTDRVIEILETLELMKDGMIYNPQSLVLEKRLRYFITGAFLASGSVNSPRSKNYHLQFVVNTEEDSRYFLKLLNRFRNDKAMDFKSIPRRNRFVLYLKKADQIAVFLAIIFSHDCMMEFENIRIEKDFLNSENRIQVCYNANYQKSLKKGEIQLQEINKLKQEGQFELLSDNEKLIAEIRINNVDASLSHIGELLFELHQIKMSKSGINHVFSKIHDRYLKLIERDQ